MVVASTFDVIATIRKHSLLDAEELRAAEAVAATTITAGSTVRELVRKGLLTPFQADALLSGDVDRLVLGKYLLVDLIGEGGMGQVFRARQPRLKRMVAVKTIRKEHLGTPGAVDRFHREAEAAARLSHPNIVLVHDADEVNGTHFLVMEFVSGTNLGDLLQESGALPVGLACDLIRQGALGLQHAHEQGLIHRDIKPANLMVTRAGVVKLLDLGLARFGPSLARDVDGQQLTDPGTMVGTADYLAPEQAEDSHRVDIRADIYSLGCTLFHLLASVVPYPARSIAAKLIAHRMNPVPTVRDVRPEVPPGVAAILQKMMAKRPEDRYQTPGEVADALAGFSTGAVIFASPHRRSAVDQAPSGTTNGTPDSATAVQPDLAGDSRPGRASPLGAAGGSSLARPGESAPAAGHSPAVRPGVNPVGIAIGTAIAFGAVVSAFAVGLFIARPAPTDSTGREPVAAVKRPDQESATTGVTPRDPERTVPPGHAPEFQVASASAETPGGPVSRPPPAAKPVPQRTVLPNSEFLTNSLGMKFVKVPAGKFLMGSPVTEPDREPGEEQHAVEITAPFWLGVYPVTQDEYRRVMTSNPSAFAAAGEDQDAVSGLDTGTFPVENVSWQDAVDFCLRLKVMPAERAAGREYRLPTEAEWEFAARAGAAQPGAFATGPVLSPMSANFAASKLGRPTPVGSYRANAFGLHDMHGNVYQWCADWFDAYPSGTQINPTGPRYGTHRVLRGGSFVNLARYCRAAYRNFSDPGIPDKHFGFRLAISCP